MYIDAINININLLMCDVFLFYHLNDDLIKYLQNYFNDIVAYLKLILFLFFQHIVYINRSPHSVEDENLHRSKVREIFPFRLL